MECGGLPPLSLSAVQCALPNSISWVGSLRSRRTSLDAGVSGKNTRGWSGGFVLAVRDRSDRVGGANGISLGSADSCVHGGLRRDTCIFCHIFISFWPVGR